MNYKERDLIGLEIVTGDGQTHTPHFRGASVETVMNEEQMQFSYIKGAFVPRGEVGGRMFPMEVIFFGDNHLSEAAKFSTSANDKRFWTIKHPYYDEIKGSPAILKQNNDNLNVTIFTFDFYESIELNVLDSVNLSLKTKFALYNAYDTLSNKDIKADSKINETNAKNNKILSKKAASAIDLKNISNKIAKADSALNSIATTPVVYMSALTKVLQAPSQFKMTINARLDVLSSTYTNMVNAAKSLPSQAINTFTEVAAAINITAMCESCLSTMKDIAISQGSDIWQNELKTRASIYSLITRLSDIYEDYVNVLNELQSANTNKVDSYYPDYEVIELLKTNILLAISYLSEQVSGALIERTYKLEYDMPLLELVHGLYGNTDEVIVQDFVEFNNLTKDEILLVPKNRNVIYYV